MKQQNYSKAHSDQINITNKQATTDNPYVYKTTYSRPQTSNYDYDFSSYIYPL